MTIVLDFLCNDPDNGNFSGRCQAIHLPDGALELNCGEIGSRAGMIMRYEGGKLYLGKIRVNPLMCKRWYGNWCWDAYRLNVFDAEKVLAYVKRQGWSCEGGWCEVADKWEKSGLTADDVRQVALEGMTGNA